MRTLALAALCVAAARPAAAQERSCTDDMTLGACFTQFRDAAANKGLKKVERETKAATTGPQTSGDPGTTTSINDFLPRFVAALLTPGLDVDSQAIAFHYNFDRLPMRVGIELNEAKLLPALSDSIPAGIRDSSLARLQRDLSDEDDVKFSLAINVERSNLGRSLYPHLPFINEVVSGLVGDADMKNTNVFQDSIVGQLDQMADASLANDSTCKGGQDRWALKCFEAESRPELIRLLAAAATETGSEVARRREILANAGLEAIAMLLNNQPQLNFTVTRNLRGDLVGRDEWTVNGRVEIGIDNNLNWLRETCEKKPVPATDASLTKAVRMARCFTNMAATDAARESFQRQRRIWGQIDYKLRDAYELRLPGDSVLIDQARSSEFKFAVGWGQYFGSVDKINRRPRLDMEASFAQRLDDALRQDQLVLKLTFVRPFTEDLGATMGFVWANKPEFVGDVTRKVGARFGLNYKLVED